MDEREKPSDEDAEGHGKKLAADDDEDDAQGHKKAALAADDDEDDAQGHKKAF